MPKALRLTATGLCVFAVLLAAGYFYFWYAPVPALPKLSAEIAQASLQSGGRERTYLEYAPANLPANAPLLIVLHGSLMDAQLMREWTGYEFESLADRHGFAVVYPNAVEGEWNTCQKDAAYPAKKLNIDDVGFMRTLIEKLYAERGIDTSKVFATGYSNGGQMVFRLALEASDDIASVAAFGASLPMPKNNDCTTSSGRPIPVMLTSGTADPLVPYEGGEATLFGFASRGLDMSAMATAQYFAKRNDVGGTPQIMRLPQRERYDPTWVKRETWSAPGKPDVILYTVFNGGHVVPQSRFRYPRLLGPTTLDVDGPSAVWDFFSKNPQPGS